MKIEVPKWYKSVSTEDMKEDMIRDKTSAIIRDDYIVQLEEYVPMEMLKYFQKAIISISKDTKTLKWKTLNHVIIDEDIIK